MNLADLFMRTASIHPDRVAVRLGDQKVTYRVLDEASARLAGLLRRGSLQVGDRVGVMLPNVAEFSVVYYGVLRAGGVVVPMNALLKAREVRFYLQDSGARWMFAWHDAAVEVQAGARETQSKVVTVDSASFDEAVVADAAPARDVADRCNSDTAVILYTSGTTGQPKGAEITHANLSSNAEVCVDLLALTGNDVVFGGLPLFHAFGQTVTLNAVLAAGGCLTLLPRFDPVRALETIARHGVTIFAGVPTMFSALLAAFDPAAHDVSSLRACISGGSALPVEVLRVFEQVFGQPVLEGYGLSETSPVASFNRLDRPRKPGSIGPPVHGVQMRVVDGTGREVTQGEVGEIQIRGPNVMKGYWRRPDATAEAIVDGWLRTGDLGSVDSDGYFRLVGRKKEVIIRGGYNVYPRELEEILHEHPAVAEAAVIGIPHPSLGEEVGAAVVLKPGTDVTVAELRQWIAGQVAAYKYPRYVWFVDELPKNETGKIQKRDIVPPADLAVG